MARIRRQYEPLPPFGQGVTFAAVDTVADINFDIRVEGTQMRLDIRCDMTGVLVESGETRPSDEVLVAIRPWGRGYAGP